MIPPVAPLQTGHPSEKIVYSRGGPFGPWGFAAYAVGIHGPGLALGCGGTIVKTSRKSAWFWR
jgi:hypothetical protein